MTNSNKALIKLLAGILFLYSCVCCAVSAHAEPWIENNLRAKVIVKEEAVLYSSPSVFSDEIEQVAPLTILFLFTPEEDGFYYVGSDPARPTGWIEQSKVVRWDHRECVNFTPPVNRFPATIYRNANDLARALETGMTKDAIGEEPAHHPTTQYAMLLPVLDSAMIRIGGQAFPALQIGYVAGETTSYRTIEENPLIDNEVALDIMFVLDTTVSMSPYIAKTKSIIDAIARRVMGLREGVVRIGLLGYRDHTDNEYVTKQFAALTTQYHEVSRILREDVRTGADSGGGFGNPGYLPEAVFDGVYEAITATNWKAGTGLRVIVLVGDASSHTLGSKLNPMRYALEDQYNAVNVVKAASQNRVRIIALDITSSYSDDNRVKTEQFMTLAQGLNAGDKGAYHQIDANTYTEQVASDVEVEISRLLQLIDLQAGTRATTQFAPSERYILMKNLVSSHTEFFTGWLSVTNRDGQNQQVSYHVFISYDDLNLTIFYMNTAILLMNSPSEQIMGVAVYNIESHTGEKWAQNEPLRKHYEKRLGLPIRTGLMNFTLEEIVNWPESRRREMVANIQRHVRLLEAHRDDPAVWFLSGQNFRYTFVPLTYFP